MHHVDNTSHISHHQHNSSHLHRENITQHLNFHLVNTSNDEVSKNIHQNSLNKNASTENLIQEVTEFISNLTETLTNSSQLTPIATTPLPLSALDKLLLEFKMIHLPGIVVSILILILTMMLCEYAYRLVIQNVVPGIFKSCVLDFISAGEATIISWELITIFHQYEIQLWTCLAFTSMVIKFYRYKFDCISCPYSHIQSYLRGFISFKHAAARILCQFLGGSVFFRLQGHMWDLGLADIHIGRSYWMSYGLCTAWLSEDTWIGFIYDFTGSLICGVSTSLNFDFELFPKVSIHIRILTASSITTGLVLTAFHHTGGFFQPLLAFARTFGCVGVLREVTLLDHVIVYWIGASLGAVLSMYMTPYVKKFCIAPCMKTKIQVHADKLKTIEEAVPYEDDHKHSV